MLPYTTLQEAETAIGRSLTAAETLWFNYSGNKSDYILYCHNIPLILILSMIVPLFYLIIELIFPNYVASYKVQPNIKISLYQNIKCYVGVLRTYILIVTPILLASYPSIKMIGIRTSLPLPSSMEIISQIIVYFLIEDYTNYWIHRLFHCKWVYENIHIVHHEYTAPMGFATQHAHWVEILVFGIPSFLGPAIVPGHMVTFLLWLALRQVEAVENHSGYDFPWTYKKLIPFSAGAEYHDYHHYVGGQSQSNFAPIFTYCDYIYGTDKGYRYRKRLLEKQVLQPIQRASVLIATQSTINNSLNNQYHQIIRNPHGQNVKQFQAKKLPMELPRFGGGDPAKWLNKVEKFFLFNNVTKERKINLCVLVFGWHNKQLVSMDRHYKSIRFLDGFCHSFKAVQ
ncbi:methylsterol monooxygenase 1-2-like isoform X2 [Rutidosis leptorrhynchoides]|uniref:methylsterol monooxygenase 1-2-like isoform X2 n=1 Tax=Rutidosis leptorrhynchoides TaxID=125765 RepID=UPI003A9A3EA8